MRSHLSIYYIYIVASLSTLNVNCKYINCLYLFIDPGNTFGGYIRAHYIYLCVNRCTAVSLRTLDLYLYPSL